MYNNTLFTPGAPPPGAEAAMARAGTRGNAFSTTEHLGHADWTGPRAETAGPITDGQGRENLRLGGFGCAAPDSPLPKQPTFLPPFENCHC